jgi:hypothetical protein
MELHFVRVCRGEARALTDEERLWVETAFNDESGTQYERATSSELGAEMRSALRECEIERGRAEALESQLEQLNLQVESLKQSSENAKDVLFELQKAHKIQEAHLREAILEVDRWKTDCGAARAQLQELEGQISQEVDRRLPEEVMKIRSGVDQVRQINSKLDNDNEALRTSLLKFIPRYVICTECDGKGKWALRDVTGEGFGAELGALIQSCSHCHGAGKWPNPEREKLGM